MGMGNGEVQPDVKLAAHLSAHLGVDVQARHLNNYIIAHWDMVQGLAHAIHDNATRNTKVNNGESND